MNLTKKTQGVRYNFLRRIKGFCVYGDSVGIPTGLKSNPRHGSPAAFVYVYIIDVITAAASCHAAPPAFAPTDDVQYRGLGLYYLCALRKATCSAGR